MKKVDVRVQRTYEVLTAALFSLLKRKSFDDLTVLEICEEADVHRATFYKHFVDKYDFLNACINLKLSALVFDEIEKPYSPHTLKANCMIMIERVYKFIENNREIFVCICKDNCSLAFNNTLSDAISNFIAEQIQTMPDLKVKLGKEVHMISNFYAGAIVGLVKWWVTDEEPCSVKYLLDYSEFHINEICNYFNMVTA